MEAEIERYLARLADRLQMEQQQKHELLVEMRGHLLDACAHYQAQGLEPTLCLQRALADFGPEVHIGDELNAVYLGWGATDAIVFTALPVIMGLLLRWLVFAPEGSAIGWEQVLTSLPFWIVALAALLAPLLKFSRWRMAAASWTLFWGITVLFVVLA